MMNKRDILLELEDVKTYFPICKGIFKRVVGQIRAVDGVGLKLYRGETLGLVGESGCGKTTLGKTIIRLYKPNSGKMVYHADRTVDLTGSDRQAMRVLRKEIQYVFQDPNSSLNPVFTVFGSIEDALKVNGVKSRAKRREIIGDLLEAVNMRRESMDLYPNEFSGGQRQRIAIARALCVQPELVICDEAVSALDVSIQAQVLQLLKKLKAERQLTYIFITHDLSVVEYVSDRIAVMYLGKIVELADTDDLFANTLHPYTQALRSAVPVADLDAKKTRIVLQGDVPSPANPPTGCAFHPRCWRCAPRCRTETPELKQYWINGKEYFVACHLAEEQLQQSGVSQIS